MSSETIDNHYRIPDIASLDDFREWLRSDNFPQRGRIDYIDGETAIQFAPEELFSHALVATEVGTKLYQRVKRGGFGQTFIFGARVTCPKVGLAVEPDVIVLLDESIVSGRVKLIPKSDTQPDVYWEIEGPPDLVVEIVSDSSVEKDTKLLPKQYFAAGVPELWLIDARGTSPQFTIFKRGKRRYEAVATDRAGYQPSAVFGCDYRLKRLTDPHGWPMFELQERA